MSEENEVMVTGPSPEETLVIAMARFAGAGNALERAIYALMSSHPNYAGLHQAMSGDLSPDKAEDIPEGPMREAWIEAAMRLLKHSATLASMAQSSQATKN